MEGKKIVPWIILTISGASLALIWIGFFFPDPSYVQRLELSGKASLMLIPRIIIPVLFVFLAVLFFLRKKKSVKSTIYLGFIMILLIYISYPLLNAVFFKVYQNRMEKYHPYLQLKPNIPDENFPVTDDDNFTIFCLGGSTTEFRAGNGTGWPEMLQTELRNIYKTDSIQVFNAGRQWYSSLHILINYVTNLRKYKPDLIIVMENINDLLQNADFSYFSTGPFREDYGHFLGPSANIIKSKGLVNTIWQRYKLKFQHLWYYKTRETVDQEFFPGLDSYTRNINSLIEIAAVDSSKVILMSQPNLYSENMDEKTKSACYMVNMEAIGKNKKWSYKTGYEGMKLFNQKIEEIAKNKNTCFIDLAGRIPKSLIYFSDEVHYKDTTFNIISKTVAEEIVKADLISIRKK